MDGFSKFDDPSNGLNPFTPNEVKATRTGYKKVCRSILTVIFLAIRLPFILLAFNVSLTLHAMKYMLVFPYLIRVAECFIDRMIGQILQASLSFNNVKISYHREHKSFDFVKQ